MAEGSPGQSPAEPLSGAAGAAGGGTGACLYSSLAEPHSWASRCSRPRSLAPSANPDPGLF